MAQPNQDIDYYELLLVSRNAPAEVIRASYRTLMQKLKRHPDLGGDTATAALINEAYAVLCDAKRRAEYDAYLVTAELGQEEIGGGAAPSAQGAAPPAPNPAHDCLFCGHGHTPGTAIAEDTTCGACASPLFPADSPRLELTGQRAVARVGKNQQITFYTHWPQASGFRGQTEDISLNGMRFLTQAKLTQGQLIKIVSPIADAIARVSNLGHKRVGLTATHVVGVAFVTLRFRQSVGGFVSERI